METVGDRLSAAIVGTSTGTVRDFQGELARRFPDLAGTSYDTIRRYLRNKPEPSAKWIRSAAEVLGVRAEWISTGRGARTEAEEWRRRAEAATRAEYAREDEPDTWLGGVIEEAAEHYYVGEWGAASWAVRALYNDAVGRCEDGERITAEQGREVVYGLFRVLDYPTQHLGGSWDMIGNYILTATGLYKMLLESDPPKTLEALIEMLWLESYGPTLTIKSDVFDQAT